MDAPRIAIRLTRRQDHLLTNGPFHAYTGAGTGRLVWKVLMRELTQFVVWKSRDAITGITTDEEGLMPLADWKQYLADANSYNMDRKPQHGTYRVAQEGAWTTVTIEFAIQDIRFDQTVPLPKVQEEDEHTS